LLRCEPHRCFEGESEDAVGFPQLETSQGQVDRVCWRTLMPSLHSLKKSKMNQVSEDHFMAVLFSTSVIADQTQATPSFLLLMKKSLPWHGGAYPL
jgi:hypothetical protein